MERPCLPQNRRRTHINIRPPQTLCQSAYFREESTGLVKRTEPTPGRTSAKNTPSTANIPHKHNRLTNHRKSSTNLPGQPAPITEVRSTAGATFNVKFESDMAGRRISAPASGNDSKQRENCRSSPFGLLQPAAAFRSTACCGTNVLNRSELERAFKPVIWQEAANTKAAVGCRSPKGELLLRGRSQELVSCRGSSPGRPLTQNLADNSRGAVRCDDLRLSVVMKNHLRMIQPEQRHERGLIVVGGDDILDSFVSELISRTVG